MRRWGYGPRLATAYALQLADRISSDSNLSRDSANIDVPSQNQVAFQAQ